VASRIPNYQLQRAQDAIPELRRATVLTLADSLHTFRLTLWDEEARKLVGFREVRGRRRTA
jgi:omega-6 fatty acid desaturase (delta-12 desaturase)